MRSFESRQDNRNEIKHSPDEFLTNLGFMVWQQGVAVTNPSTGDTCEYGKRVRIGSVRKIDLSKKDQTFVARYYREVEKERLEMLAGVEEEGSSDLFNFAKRIGAVAVLGAASTPAVLGVLNGAHPLTIGAYGALVGLPVAIKGAKDGVKSRREKADQTSKRERYEKILECSYNYAYSIGPNLFSPDTYVPVRSAEGVYYIGETPVEQDERVGAFWREVDEIVSETGMPELQGFKEVGFGDLVVHALINLESKDLNESSKEKVDFELGSLVRRRNEAIEKINKIHSDRQALTQRDRHREKWGVEKSPRKPKRLRDLESKAIYDHIVKIDQEYTQEVRKFFEAIEDARFSSEVARQYSTLKDIISQRNTSSSLQNGFCGLLARIAVNNDTNAFGASMDEPIRFISSLPEITWVRSVDKFRRVETLEEAQYGLSISFGIPLPYAEAGAKTFNKVHVDGATAAELLKVYEAFCQACKNSGLSLVSDTPSVVRRNKGRSPAKISDREKSIKIAELLSKCAGEGPLIKSYFDQAGV